jgi:histidinol phosphatase-like PHP family hydrolase
MISDIVLLGNIPDKVKNNVLAYVGCIAGAEKKDEYIKEIKQAGFQQLQILDEAHLPEVMFDQPDAKEIIGKMNLTKKEISEIANDVVSVKISAVKP